jgi:hypothetical protein
MAKVSFDGPNKLIIVDPGITELDVRVDIYSDWKEWLLLSDNIKYLPALSAIGGDPISAGVFVGTTYFLENSWRIRPYEGTHQLTIVGNIYTRESGGSPVIPTVGDFNVLVTMFRSNIVDTISTGGGSDPNDVASAVWNYPTGSFASSTFGNYIITKILTIAHYLGMK